MDGEGADGALNSGAEGALITGASTAAAAEVALVLGTGRRVCLWVFGRGGRRLGRVVEDGIRDVDSERGRVGVGPGSLAVVLGVDGIVLATENLGLELLEMGALLRHGGQMQGEGEGDKGKERKGVGLPAC